MQASDFLNRASCSLARARNGGEDGGVQKLQIQEIREGTAANCAKLESTDHIQQ
jgi:hypothetical protein